VGERKAASKDGLSGKDCRAKRTGWRCMKPSATQSERTNKKGTQSGALI